jgi:hypothetical protein
MHKLGKERLIATWPGRQNEGQYVEARRSAKPAGPNPTSRLRLGQALKRRCNISAILELAQPVSTAVRAHDGRGHRGNYLDAHLRRERRSVDPAARQDFLSKFVDDRRVSRLEADRHLHQDFTDLGARRRVGGCATCQRRPRHQSGQCYGTAGRDPGGHIIDDANGQCHNGLLLEDVSLVRAPGQITTDADAPAAPVVT